MRESKIGEHYMYHAMSNNVTKPAKRYKKTKDGWPDMIFHI